MKAYTDLEQSKKLSEILPLESADMHYWKRTWRENDYAISVGHSKELQEGFESKCIEYIPCWSLAALLEIIKKLVGYSLQSLDTHTVFMNCELGDKPYNIETENYDNPIDACYEMIIKLHELKML